MCILLQTKYDPTTEFLEILKREGQLEDPQIAEFTNKKVEELFQGVQVELNKNKELRAALLEEMKVWHQKFHTGGVVDDDERSKALKQLTAAYDVFLECESNLQEGAKVSINMLDWSITITLFISCSCFHV